MISRIRTWLRRHFHRQPTHAELNLAATIAWYTAETKMIPLRIIMQYRERLAEFGIHAERMNEKMPVECMMKVFRVARRRRMAKECA